jgi:hypothetical protein
MADEQRPVDADNHYYEALDAFTRHLDKRFKHRGVRVVHDGSHTEVLIAGPPLYQVELVSDTFVAASNGTYTEAVTSRETNGSTVTTTTDNSNGTWSQTNGSVTVTDANGTVTTAAVSGNTITLNVPGLVAVFHRQ